MLFSSLLLLLAAAALHAVANALLKQARDKLAFSWWMLGVFIALCSPVLFFIPNAGATAWLIVLASGLLEALYFVTLARAYTHGDLSVVYPIARGSAPLFLLLWGSTFLRERPTSAGLTGIFAIVAGLYLINLPALSDWKRPLLGFRSPASRWALLTGALISGYSAIDKVGVTYFPPFVYLYLLLLVCWLALSFQWLFPARRSALLQEIRKNQGDTPLLRSRVAGVTAAALMGTGAYFLVLAAMQLSPVTYVGPVREVSVVIGAWIGIRFLAEKGGALRIAACILVAIGIILIAAAG